ncbi:Uncharacterized iron-regulated membrane protein [Chitinophaga costaii]|uniref:Uncharacterized iron-regulated membrane protein n=1 Tax=Chitinophaga costaii TaxID=1335309 RepID=A0A1C4FU42_9BACT|nr:PepSY-associated TM helix domain-containing protein [Chitinophaga costaii]PUZ27207.1 PepSY domain-containing protein [Chitinophaga costaii]SCC59354.1 Uncharacterized iron-regulated membrane protein [Chitinophaga costaii]
MKVKKYNFRKFCNDVHLWLGMASSIVLFVICLTGTIFVFHTEIEKLLYPKWFKAQMDDGKKRSPDELIATVENHTKGKVVIFTIPASPDEVWMFSVKNKPANAGMPVQQVSPTPAMGNAEDAAQEKNKIYYVDPYTGEITGVDKSPAGEFFRTVEDIHRWFFVGKPVGKTIGGTAAIIFVLLIISGIVIWWPRKIKHWKEGFKIKFSARWKRVNYDLHRALGIYVFPVILLSAITGPAWSFEWYRSGFSKLLGSEVLKKKEVKTKHPAAKAAPAETITYARVLELADSCIKAQSITVVTLPAEKGAAISIAKTHVGFLNLSAIDKIQIDPSTGTVLKTMLFSHLTISAKIATSFRAIHVGEIFGSLSKIIYFIACLLATSLPISGILVWYNKWKK